MPALFTRDEALGAPALIDRDQVADITPPSRWVTISCAVASCTAHEWAEVNPYGPAPDSIPLWRQIGWVETLAGAYCPDHRNPRNR